MKKLTTLFNIILLNGTTSLAFAAEEASSPHAVNALNDIVYPWINFIILLSLMIYFIRKPAKEFFLARSQKVAQEIEQAAHEKHDAEAKYLNYDRRLKNIESEMDTLLQSLKKEGELARQKIMDEAQNSSKRIEETTHWIVNQEIRKAKEDLKKKSVEIIAQKAQQLVKENIQASDRGPLLDKAINKLEAAV